MSYKIIEKAVMPDGIAIQLEDWSENNIKEYPKLYGFMIGAYPIAKNDGKYGFVRKRDKFRLSISQSECRNYKRENVIADFEALKKGQKTLEDCWCESTTILFPLGRMMRCRSLPVWWRIFRRFLRPLPWQWRENRSSLCC